MTKTFWIILLLVAANIGWAAPQKKPPKPTNTVSLVYDITAQQPVYSEHADRVISIASMTKLVTALAILEAGQNLSELITVVRSRDASPRIRAGMRMARLDLLSLTMISSDNLAARTLAEHYPGGYEAGIQAMNSLVQRIGAGQTVLVEPTGVMAANISTAQDVARISEYAARDPLFRILANQKTAQVTAERRGRVQEIVEWVTGRATNPFLAHPVNFEMLVAKTGFTTAAGFCLTMVVEYNNRRYVVVTAGHSSRQARKQQADRLIQEITDRKYQVMIVSTEEEVAADK